MTECLVEHELLASLDLFEPNGGDTRDARRYLCSSQQRPEAEGLRLMSKLRSEYPKQQQQTADSAKQVAAGLNAPPPKTAGVKRPHDKDEPAKKTKSDEEQQQQIEGGEEEEDADVRAVHEAATKALKLGTEQKKEGSTSTALITTSGSSTALIVGGGANKFSEAAKKTAAAHSAAMSILRPKPQWHAPWVLHRVVSGHMGWVRCVCVDPANEWYATGSADQTIKIWDLATGRLKLTLTGHISTVRGLAVSDTMPYLFSCGEDKTVKCWDLETNTVVRHYHGHLSGVYCCALHPTLRLLVTGGRDASVRVWDIRTQAAVHVLEGHTNSVMSVSCQAAEPQIVSGSMDSTVRLWDLVAGRTATTLTHHKKGVRSVAMHSTDYGMITASADNIKQWSFPAGTFVTNFSGQNTIVNGVAINPNTPTDDIVATVGDNGSIFMWDWKTGYNFQRLQTIPQPGSLDSEASIFGVAFDKTGLRMITCEADKSVKVWRPDETATPETHPITDWNPSRPRPRF